MAKGLNKAERHRIKRRARGWRVYTALRFLQQPSSHRRIIAAELHKRGYRYDDSRQCWTQRARLR